MKFKIGDCVIVKEGTRYSNQRKEFGMQKIIHYERYNIERWQYITNMEARYVDEDLELYEKVIKQYGIVAFMKGE